MPGPPPKLTALKLLEGTARKDRANPHEPQPTGELGTAPEHLDKDQRQAWSEVAAAAWWGTASDRPALELLALSLGDSRRLRRELENESAIVQGSRGRVRNPKSYLLRESEDRAARLLSEFGLTPSSRSRVQATRKPDSNRLVARPRDRSLDVVRPRDRSRG